MLYYYFSYFFSIKLCLNVNGAKLMKKMTIVVRQSKINFFFELF